MNGNPILFISVRIKVLFNSQYFYYFGFLSLLSVFTDLIEMPSSPLWRLGYFWEVSLPFLRVPWPLLSPLFEHCKLFTHYVHHPLGFEQLDTGTMLIYPYSLAVCGTHYVVDKYLLNKWIKKQVESMCMLIETNCIDSRPESIGKFRILWRLGKIFSWVTPSSWKCLLSVIILLSWPSPLKLNSTPQPCTPIPLLPCSIFPTVFIRFAHCFSSSVEYKAESKRVFFSVLFTSTSWMPITGAEA